MLITVGVLLILCRVDACGTVKVADFGLSRELVMHDYYRLSHNRTPVPVRWMAPESLELNVFTTMSDVVGHLLFTTLAYFNQCIIRPN